ncbi:uncharacterized protein LOC125210469 [Salvia hispanica]|uniref:uncharacterized protein LOC125210469 n=1 Tax=Salvia hispanica TaxID=49212 RepID=UPI0020097A7B|nr:uncharacterized protein LOC125210469 [Salvia hispanica]
MERSVMFKVTSQHGLCRTNLPHHQIRFYLFFRTQYHHIRYSATAAILHPTPTAENHPDIETVFAAVRGNLSYDFVEEALGEELRERLRGHEIGRAIRFAWRHVRRVFQQRRAEEIGAFFRLDVDMEIRVGIWNDRPAAPAALRRLVKCNDEEDLGWCCICLDDELDADVDEKLKMPCCWNVFHTECIQGWLGKSHYCPLCQFEMPTATAD